MRRRIVEVLHVDAAKVCFYEPEDLDHFSRILDELFGELTAERSPLAAPENAAGTRTRLAVALFECAETGERDRDRLKRRARAALDKLGTPEHLGH